MVQKAGGVGEGGVILVFDLPTSFRPISVASFACSRTDFSSTRKAIKRSRLVLRRKRGIASRVFTLKRERSRSVFERR